MILPASIEVIQLDSADLEGLVAKEKLSNLAPFHIIHDATLVDSCRDVASTSNDAKEKLKNLLAQIHSIMAIDGRLIVRSFYWKLNEVGVLFEGLFQLEANLTNMPLSGKDQLNVFVLRKHQA